MSAFVAIVGTGSAFDAGAIRRALLGGGPRLDDRSDVVQHGDAVFGSTRNTRLGGAAAAALNHAIASDERHVVVADATLYYLDDLRRALPGQTQRVAAASTAQLVLEAYRAFGAACVDHLEGDFAFVVWDRRARRLFCARDLSGRRPLYYGSLGHGLAVASSLGALAALPGFRAEADVATVGCNAAGLFYAVGDETSMRGVRSLAGGCVATWSAGATPLVERYWNPTTSSLSTVGFRDAAVELRSLLQAATMERVSGPRTAVWMSGGRDSTAVFASGMSAARANGVNVDVFPVSRSHPLGDSEREDEAVEEVARYWNVTPSWLDVRKVPLFDDAGAAAPWSTDSFEQPFRALTCGLARLASNGGATVVLDGHGGDFLFQVSRVYLSDLVARGRMAQAWREWRAMDGGREGVRGFIRTGVQSHLSRLSLYAASSPFRSRVRGAMERVAPPWISERFLARHAIEDQCRARGPDAQPGHDAADRETRFCLTHPFFSRVNAAIGGYARGHGVELRSPLLDRRVVEFALRRPREERNLAGDRKRLLRAAMHGLLPQSTLAAQQRKTGTLRTYFAYHMHNDGLDLLRRCGPTMALADHGIVEPGALSLAVERFAIEGPAYPHVEALFCTLQAEQWLRINGSARATSRASDARHGVASVSPSLSCRGGISPHPRRAGGPTALLEAE